MDAARFLFFVLKNKCYDSNKKSTNRKEVLIYSMETDDQDYNLVEIGVLVNIDLIEKFQKYVAAYCTPRQKQIIAHFMLGKNNYEIADAIGINFRTVSTLKLKVFDHFRKWYYNE